MKVQLAKESFMDRLKREQEENNKKHTENGCVHEPISSTDLPSKKQKINGADEFSTRKFESKAKEEKNGKQQASNGDSKKKKKDQSDSDSSDSEDDQVPSLPAFKGLLAYPELQSTNTEKLREERKEVEVIERSEEAAPNPVAQKLLKIASSVGTRPMEKPKPFIAPVKTVSVPSSVKWNVSKEAEQPAYDNLQSKLLAIAGVAESKQRSLDSSTFSNKKEGVTENRQGPLNFRKRDSDAVRQKSLEARMNLNQARSSIIKSSLSQVQPPANESKEPSKLSAALFGDDEAEENEDSNAFKIRPQFEGKGGERNLELSSKFASYDNRFALDERFREEEEGEVGENATQEKEKMFSILSDVLGSTVAPKLKPKEGPSINKSVIIKRYDPENVTDVQPEGNAETPGQKRSSELATSKAEGAQKNSGQSKEEDGLKGAIYHVAPNLKDLFSSSSQPFSLLSTFGTSVEEADEQDHATRKPEKISNFWEGKKFKYDSSDSENEDDLPATTLSIDELKQAKSKDRFFFKKNDKRFEGLDYFFLHNTENIEDVVYRFYNGERSELKLICKSKIKNTKRKSEKRMETLRRLKRKMKNKRKTKYAPQGSNAIPIGTRKNSK